MTYSIRHATNHDCAALSLIGAATFLNAFADQIEGKALIKHCQSEHSEATYAAYLAKPRTAAWLIEAAETGAPLGYALNCAPDLPIADSSGDIELKRIYLLPQLYGSGAADTLVEASIAHSRAQEAKRLLLGTYEGNARAKAFYEKHGFISIGTRQFNIGGVLHDDIVMAKSL